MVQETEEVNAEHETGTAFLEPAARYRRRSISASTTARIRRTQRPRRCATCSWFAPTTTRWLPATAPAPVAAKRACCAPLPPSPRRTCGRFTTPRAIASLPRPASLKRPARRNWRALKASNPEEYARLRQAIAHLVMGLGGEDSKGHQGAHCGLRSGARRNHRRAVGRGHCRGAAHRGLQPQEPAAHRRTPGQRHERDGHGRAHGLQHGLRFHRAEQSASLSVDELALPGRRDRGLAHGRELHRRSRAALRDSRAAGRHRSSRATRMC